MNQPGLLVHVTASPMAKATRYRLQKLRCNLCGTVYTANPPEGIGPKKYDESLTAMVMINKYFMSVPGVSDKLCKYLKVSPSKN